MSSAHSSRRRARSAAVHGRQLPVTSKDGGSCVPLILFSWRRSGNNSFDSETLIQNLMNACGSNDMASLCASICFFSERTHPASALLPLHLCLLIRHLHPSFTYNPPIRGGGALSSPASVCLSTCATPAGVSPLLVCIKCVCENVCIDISSVICPLRPSCAPRSSEGCHFLLLRSRFSSVFHSGVKRGVCSQINHFPEDADFDHDGAEYVLRKSKAALSQFSGERVYFF